MKKFTILFVVCLFLFNNQANAQTFTNYTKKSTSTALWDWCVKAIAIDSEGNKWFVTDYSVSKFDGTNWTTYTFSDGLPLDQVNAIAIDKEGNKWFGTRVGVSKFDGTNWTTYIDRFISVNAIAIDAEGNKWFGTSGDVSKFDDTTWTTYTTSDGLAENHVNAIAIDAEGNKWFGTNGGGVSKFDDINWTTYTTSDGLVSNIITAIAIDAEGNKWFGTPYGVSKFDGTNWTTYTTADGLVNNNVHAIAIDKDSNKWIGCIGYWTENLYIEGVVSKFDGTNWTTYTTSDGLAYNCVNVIAIDAEGNKWFGTSYGVSKFDGTNWTTFTVSERLLDDNVMAIAIDAEGNKWFGTYNGVSKFDGTNWTTYTEEDGLVFTDCLLSKVVYVSAIAIDAEGNKWFGTFNGVSKFNGTNWATYLPIPDTSYNGIGAIAIDASSNIWITIFLNYCMLHGHWQESFGVSKFDGTNWTTYTTADGLVSNHVNAIAIDAEGNKWFGTVRGVSKFDGTNWTTYTTSDGLIDSVVNAIAIDSQGNKWFGTSNGVSVFDGTNWTTYTTADGLVDSVVNAIAIDAEGNKWFGTGVIDWYDGHCVGGVSKFDDSTWTTYTEADGLVNNYVNAIVIDAKGNKWFGTSSGVSKLSAEGPTVNLYIFPNNHEVSFEAGDTTFSVSSNIDWTVTDDADWLIVSPTNGSGNGAIIASYTANTLATSRVATITISGSGKSDSVIVTQEGVKTLYVIPDTFNVSYEAGDTTFSVSSNIDWTVTADADWLILNPTNGSGNVAIIASYTANTLATSRVATITISGTGVNSDSVTVTQSGNPFISVPSLYALAVTIYPDPVKDNLYIKFDDASLTDILISLVDVCGRRIIQREFEHIDLDEEQVLDLSFFKSGIYFMEIRSERNSRVYKIIKE
jgi:ligand-binding sensor domain-containing protein